MKIFVLRFIFIMILSFNISAKSSEIDLNIDFPHSLFKVNSPYTLLQSSLTNNLYLIDEKSNYAGCEKVLNQNIYEWPIDINKYINITQNFKENLSIKNLKKIRYVLLINEPLNKKTNIKKALEEKHENGELFCEAIRVKDIKNI